MTTADLPSLEQYTRRLAAIPERPMRRAEVQRWLHFGDPDVVAQQLDELVIRSCRNEADAQIAQLAFVDFLLFAGEDDDLPLNALDLAAERGPYRAAVYMLTDPPPHRHLAETARKNTRLHRPVPLGMRKWYARLQDAQMLDRLLADPDPAVIGNLCQNPRIREADVVAIASRRPNWSNVLDAVAQSKWLVNRSVCQSLIQNPYSRTGLALNLLPQMSPRFLARLRFATDLHPLVVEAATYFFTFDPSRQLERS